VIEHNGKALCIVCTESVGALLMCISFKTEDVNSYVIFSNPKPQLAHSGYIAVLALWNTSVSLGLPFGHSVYTRFAIAVLRQGCQTRFSSRATSGIFNLKRAGPVKSLHNILL